MNKLIIKIEDLEKNKLIIHEKFNDLIKSYTNKTLSSEDVDSIMRSGGDLITQITDIEILIYIFQKCLV